MKTVVKSEICTVFILWVIFSGSISIYFAYFLHCVSDLLDTTSRIRRETGDRDSLGYMERVGLQGFRKHCWSTADSRFFLDVWCYLISFWRLRAVDSWYCRLQEVRELLLCSRLLMPLWAILPIIHRFKISLLSVVPLMPRLRFCHPLIQVIFSREWDIHL